MNAKARIAFAIVAVLWGIPYLLIKIAVDDGVPPTFVAWVRVVLGAFILLAFSWKLGLLATLRQRLKWIIAFALAEIIIPYPLIASGEQHVDSSVAAILIAAAPLFVALLALRFDHTERVGGWRLAGLLIGLVGVAMFVGIDIAGRRNELFGAVSVLIAAFCYAVGPMILKKHLADLDPRVTMCTSLFVGAVLLAPGAALQLPKSVPSMPAMLSLLGLGVLCTACAFVAYGTLIVEAGPGRSLVVTYLNPVVAVALGMAVRGERLGIGAVLGLGLILVGSWLSTEGVPGRRDSDRDRLGPVVDPGPDASEGAAD